MERPPRAGPALRHCSEPNTAGSIAGAAENPAMANNVAVKRRYLMDGNYIAACAQDVPRPMRALRTPLSSASIDNLALVAGPLSPLNPGIPVPATVVITPLETIRKAKFGKEQAGESGAVGESNALLVARFRDEDESQGIGRAASY